MNRFAKNRPNMYLNFIGTAILACITLASCGSSGDNDISLNGYAFSSSSDVLTNSYLPGKVGDVINFQGNGSFSGYVYVWTFTAGEVIQGVSTLHEMGVMTSPNGEASTVFDSMIAQDTQGNVHVLKNYVGDVGSLSGVAAGLAPTFLMPADPTVGQSFGPSVNYTGVVVATDETVGSYDDVLHTQFIVDLGDSKSNRYDDYWAPEIGPIKTTWALGNGETGFWQRAD